MRSLKQVQKEITELENRLKNTDDYNEQWKIGHKLRHLYYEEYIIKNGLL